MKKIACLVAIVISVVCPAGAQTVSCDASLWNHVYNDYRLSIDSACMDVTGTVYSLIYEADGDIHIRLTVDPQFSYMLNSSNYSGELGKLVLEPICATTVTQSDAISSCRGFTNTVYIPNVGERITARGPYVTDNDHGWNELHPLTSITLHGAAAVQALDQSVMEGFKVYPSPADDQLSMEFAAQLHAPTYITIYDQLGRSGGNYQLLDTRRLTITTTYLPDGIYIYSIRQTAGVLGQGQFTVRHVR